MISKRGYRWLSCGLAFAVVAGCAGYRVGTESLFPSDVHTVYVPIFESKSYRRNLGEWLTEAVVKQIELSTPYKVVGDPNADSVLSGTIMSTTKRTVVVNPLDDPRESEINFVVNVRWYDRSRNILAEGNIALPPEMISLGREGQLVPEVGQSMATTQQGVIKSLAEQIVGLMEIPWGELVTPGIPQPGVLQPGIPQPVIPQPGVPQSGFSQPGW